jgi:prefoldin subunit 5
MKELLYIIIPTIVSALVGYFVGLRKENVDLCGERLDALEKSINVYNVIIDDLSNKVESLRAEISALEVRIEELMTENKHLKKYNGL